MLAEKIVVKAFAEELGMEKTAQLQFLRGVAGNIAEGLLGGVKAVAKPFVAPKKSFLHAVKSMGPIWVPITVGQTAKEVYEAKTPGEVGEAIGSNLGWLLAWPYGKGLTGVMAAGTVASSILGRAGRQIGGLLE